VSRLQAIAYSWFLFFSYHNDARPNTHQIPECISILYFEELDFHNQIRFISRVSGTFLWMWLVTPRSFRCTPPIFITRIDLSCAKCLWRGSFNISCQFNTVLDYKHILLSAIWARQLSRELYCTRRLHQPEISNAFSPEHPLTLFRNGSRST